MAQFWSGEYVIGVDVPNWFELIVHQERGIGIQVRELSTPAGHHDRVPVRGGVERADVPALTVRQRDEAVAAGVQTGDALGSPVGDFDPHGRRPWVGADDACDLEHGRAHER